MHIGRHTRLSTSFFAVVVSSFVMLVGSPVFADSPSSSDPIDGGESVIAPTSPKPAPTGEIKDLKQQLDFLKARIDLLESQQQQQAQLGLDARTKEAAAVAAAKAKPPSGIGVHIVETANTDVRLYGLIEATFANITNTTNTGLSQVGMPVSWFSGNRWGLDISQKFRTTPAGAKPATNELNSSRNSKVNSNCPAATWIRRAFSSIETRGSACRVTTSENSLSGAKIPYRATLQEFGAIRMASRI